MAYLTDDKRTLILTCKLCGGEVRYSTNYPFASETLKDQLEKVLSVWQEKAETCDACLFGPTVGAPDVKPQPQTGTAAYPPGPRPGETTAPCEEVPQGPQPDIKWPHSATTTAPFKDHTPPRLYDAKECQALLRQSHGRTLKFIREEIIPLGGCVRVGNRYLVHAWALNIALEKRSVTVRPKRVYPPGQTRGLRSKRSTPPSPLTLSEKPSSPSGGKSSV